MMINENLYHMYVISINNGYSNHISSWLLLYLFGFLFLIFLNPTILTKIKTTQFKCLMVISHQKVILQQLIIYFLIELVLFQFCYIVSQAIEPST